MNLTRRFAVLLSAAALALAVIVPGAIARDDPSTGAAWIIGTANFTYENVLADAINDEHHRVCGTWLDSEANLDSYARYKAADMGWENYYSHINEQGHAYYDLWPNGAITYSGQNAAEILVYNTYADLYSAGQAMNSFMGSPTHKAAIQNCVYVDFGVGNFKANNGRRYWVAEFKKP